VDRRRLRHETNGEIAGAHTGEAFRFPAAAGAAAGVRLHQAAIIGHGRRLPAVDRQDAYARGLRAERRHDDFHGASSDRDIRAFPAEDAARERYACTGRADSPDRLTPCHRMLGHARMVPDVTPMPSFAL
jgi:hypothetical protein